MAKIDEQLVKRIADEVVAVIQGASGPAPAAPAQQSAPASQQAAPTGPVRLRPPVGVCTGDYSKFAELLGQPVGAKRPGTAIERTTHLSDPATTAKPERIAGPAEALEGFVTAQQLEAAIKASPDGIARLAAAARLTPLAADFARQHPEKVQRVDHAERPGSARRSTSQHGNPNGKQSPNPVDAPTWLWWADGHCPAVQSLTSEHGHRLRPSAAPRSDIGLVEVVRDLAGLIDAGRVTGGLLFVRSAARAVCYANRCKVLRAIVGTCAETVDEGITELGANVLVIEYPYISPATMNEMVKRMLAQPATLPANVARHLTDLHCR